MGLDTSVATPIYGSSRAAWRQGERYYDRAGQEITPDEAALPDIHDEIIEPEPQPEETVPTYRDGNSGFNPPPRVERPPLGPNASMESRLKKMDARCVQRLVEQAGGRPYVGHGSKNQNMKWLLKNAK